MENKISVVVHTYNNELFIRECLESVKDFDEIVICDMYSTDKTLEIAKEYNAKIVMHENIGWADPARNFAISQASNEWVFVVDSDEVITPELKNYLYEFINNPEYYTAVRIPRMNYYWNKPIEMYYPDQIIRFFKRDLVDWPPYVHGTPSIKSGKIKVIDGERREMAIKHRSVNSFAAELNTLNKYSTLEVDRRKGSGKKPRIGNAIWKLIWTPIEKFLLKGGYKDGTEGLILCIRMGIYKFTTEVKYWEYVTLEEQKAKENKD